jgi:hypothetical protein
MTWEEMRFLLPLRTQVPSRASKFYLEQQLQCELNLPGGPYGSDLTESRIGGIRDGNPKMGCVPTIKKLGPELQSGPLRDRRVLEQRKVPIVDPGCRDRVPRAVSERPKGGNLESACIKPLRYGPLAPRKISLGDTIRPLRASRESSNLLAVLTGNLNRKWLAAGKSQDGVKLPALDGGVESLRQAGEVALTRAKRELIDRREGQTVRLVEA